MARRLQALSAAGDAPAPFLLKTFDLVSDEGSNDIVSWRDDGQSFIVYRQDLFSRNLLPLYFKHNNFSSFVRQLNTYGFRKVDADTWEFSQDFFRRGRSDLLSQIQRRRGGGGHQAHGPSAAQSAIEIGQFGGLADDVEALKRDKNVLMAELVRVRHQQQDATKQMSMMQSRLDSSEQRQTQMIQFLSKALQHPELLQQLVGARQRISHDGNPVSGRKKLKRRAARADTSADSSGDQPFEAQPNHDNQLVAYQGGAGAAANGMVDGNDRLSFLDVLDEADSSHRPPHSAALPHDVTRMGTELHSMRLVQETLPNGSRAWASCVQIAEHDPMVSGVMPLAADDTQMSMMQPNSTAAAAAGSTPLPDTAALLPPSQLHHVKREMDESNAQQALQGVRSMSLGLGESSPSADLGRLPEDVLLSGLDGLSASSAVDSDGLGNLDIFSSPDPQMSPESGFPATSASPAVSSAFDENHFQGFPATSAAVPATSALRDDGSSSFPVDGMPLDSGVGSQQRQSWHQQQHRQPSQPTYDLNDFNQDLLHSGDAIGGDAVTLPPAESGGDDLWQQFLAPTSPEASA